MIKNLLEFVKVIKERGVDTKGSIYAQIIKNERTKRKMTLQEVSEGICSISYLCKLENYNITTGKQFVKAIFERMDLNYDKAEALEENNLITEVLKYYFHDQYENLKELYQTTKNLPYSSSAEIVKGFYYLETKNYQEIENIISSLDKIKYTLGGLEALTLIYLVVRYKVITFHFPEALFYLRNIEVLEIPNKYLNFLLMEANLITALYLNNGCRFYSVYESYEKNNYVGYPIGRRIEAKMLYNLFKVNDYPFEVLDDITSLNIESVPCEYRMSVLYYQMLISLKHGSYEQVFTEIIQNEYFGECEFLGLLAYITYKMNDNNMYKKLLDIVSNYSFKEYDAIHQKFICFVLLYASNINKIELLAYMRKEINPYLEKEVIPIYNEVYEKIFLKYLLEDSKYKESYYFLANRVLSNS